MPIAFFCSYCGRRLEAPQSEVGQLVSCHCGVAVKVPCPQAARRRKPRPESTGKQLVFNCPRCKKRFKVDNAAAGRRIECPCGQRFVISSRKAPSRRPNPRAADESDQPAPRATATVSFNCNHCRKRFVLSVDLIGQKGRCDCGLAYVVPGSGGKSSSKPGDGQGKPNTRADTNNTTPPGEPPGKRVIFRCPRCNRRIAVPAINAGRKADCTCGARFVVPTRGGRPPKDLNKSAPAESK